MKFKYLTLLVSLLLLLTACGETGTASEPAPAEPETFGAENIDSAPEQMAGTTALPETGPAEPFAEETPSGSEDLDRLALISVLVSEYVDGQTYDRLSSGCFWLAVGYLVGQGVGAPIADGQVKITEAELKPVVTALFGPYEEQYPSLSEEDPLVSQEYVDGQYVYTVTTVDPFDYTVDMGELEPQEDGSYVCAVSLLQGGEVLAEYTVTLTDYPAEAGLGFTYSITGVAAA